MRRFLITITIGFLLCGALIARIILTAPADSNKYNSNKSGQNSKKSQVAKTLLDEKQQEADEIHILKAYYDNGKLSSEWPFRAGRLEGNVRQFYPSGKLLRETPYHANLPSGTVKTYYENERIWSEYSFVNGVSEGAGREYYPDGVLWAEINFQDGKIQAIHIFSESKGLGEERSETGVADLSGSYSGVETNSPVLGTKTSVKVFYSDKHVSAEVNLKGEQLDGEFKLFYPDGQIYKQFQFENNAAIREFKIFYSDKSLWVEGSFVNGFISGTVTEYYPGGNLWVETQYLTGMPNGIPKAYSESGKIFQETRVKIESK